MAMLVSFGVVAVSLLSALLLSNGAQASSLPPLVLRHKIDEVTYGPSDIDNHRTMLGEYLFHAKLFSIYAFVLLDFCVTKLADNQNVFYQANYLLH